jgi:hypothetical protein
VAQGRWAELVQWMGGRRRALKTGAKRALALASPSWARQQVMKLTRYFCLSDLLERSLTTEGRSWLAPHLRQQYSWEIDGFVPLHQSIRQRVLADWVAVRVEDETRLAAAYGMAKAFPLLDEGLIATLLHQDPALFGEAPGRGRLLHRRAFAPFLPPFLRDTASKAREPEAGTEQYRRKELIGWRDSLERSLAASRDWHPELALYWDLAAIRQETEQILANADSSRKVVIGTTWALRTLHQLSAWWQALEG